MLAMPITRSAKKAHRASLKKRVFNQRRKDKVGQAIKTFKKAPSPELYQKVQKALDKAVKGNTLKKNTASRKKSRLSKLLKKDK
jgi:small subunit ribosomal protein S20